MVRMIIYRCQTVICTPTNLSVKAKVHLNTHLTCLVQSIDAITPDDGETNETFAMTFKLWCVWMKWTSFANVAPESVVTGMVNREEMYETWHPAGDVHTITTTIDEVDGIKGIPMSPNDFALLYRIFYLTLLVVEHVLVILMVTNETNWWSVPQSFLCFLLAHRSWHLFLFAVMTLVMYAS